MDTNTINSLVGKPTVEDFLEVKLEGQSKDAVYKGLVAREKRKPGFLKGKINGDSSPERLAESREWCRKKRRGDEGCEERKKSTTRTVLNAWANYLKERVLEEVSLENINLKASNFDKHLIRPEIVGFAA